MAAHRSGDYTTALRELRPFAEQGDADAQFVLGVMYGEGKGVSQNYKTALQWYTLAAEQGHVKAHTLLGSVYSLGEGFIQDYARSHMWFNIAASSGESKQASKSRDFVAKRMTPAQIAEAQKLAREYARKKYKGC